MEIKSFKNKKYFVMAKWMSRCVGLIYIAFAIFGISFLIGTFENSIFHKPQSVILFLKTFLSLWMGLVFYALSTAFALLLEVMAEVEKTI